MERKRGTRRPRDEMKNYIKLKETGWFLPDHPVRFSQQDQRNISFGAMLSQY